MSPKGTKNTTFSPKFVYTDEVFRRKPVRQPGQDLQDVATYTLPEAAMSLAVPRRTLHRWFAGSHPILKPSSRYGEAALLSFRDVAEAYLLEILRTVYGFNFRTLRSIVENAKLETGLKRPLIEADLQVVLNKVVLNRPKRGRRARYSVDLKQYPQFVIPELVDIVGKRILFDNSNTPYRIHPWRLMNAKDTSTPITLDPDVMSGRAVVTGTRIPITLLLGMKRSGQSVYDIASSYNLGTDVVTKALQHVETPLSKVA